MPPASGVESEEAPASAAADASESGHAVRTSDEGLPLDRTRSGAFAENEAHALQSALDLTGLLSTAPHYVSASSGEEMPTSQSDSSAADSTQLSANDTQSAPTDGHSEPPAPDIHSAVELQEIAGDDNAGERSEPAEERGGKGAAPAPVEPELIARAIEPADNDRQREPEVIMLDVDAELAEVVAASVAHERAAEVMEAVARRVRSGEIVVSVSSTATEAIVVASVLTALLKD
ncbi:MAG: hypothetical protein ACT4OZ_05730 [Gemmatimonadota bacterium]